MEFGTNYHIEIFGASHEPEIGVCIKGVPAGEAIDLEELTALLARRSPSHTPFGTPRRENDIPQIIQGITNGVTDGRTIIITLPNRDIRPQDYAATASIPRPGHADYPAYIKDGAIPSGGGIYSGRMTAAYCIAGGIALQQLKKEGVRVQAEILSIGGIPAEKEKEIQAALTEAASEGDSLGGVIGCRVTGLPVGLGEHPFRGLENHISEAVFAIPAIKGIEFGDGFALTSMKGSEANDAYYMENGKVICKTNHSGGISGGMANGMPLTFRVAVKPTPSIARAQNSVDLVKGENVMLSVKGRHDTCLALRAAPVVEAAAAAAIYDLLLGESKKEADLAELRRRLKQSDDILLRSLCERMRLVRAISDYKAAHGLPVLDKEREERLLEELLADTPPVWRDAAARLYPEIFAVSRYYQTKWRKEKE